MAQFTSARRHGNGHVLGSLSIWLVASFVVRGASFPAGEDTWASAPWSTATPVPARAAERPWLGRPVPAQAANIGPDRFYPYGATGHGRYPPHHGVEFVNPAGTPALAVAEGTIVVAGSDDLEVWGQHLDYYGRLVILRLEARYGTQPVYALYGHLSQVLVRVGQRVHKGEVIGLIGSTGIAMGPHLHFEVRVGKNTFAHTRNPELWLAPLPGQGTIAGRVTLDGQPVPEALLTFHPAERPDRYWREAWTYAGDPAEQIRPDDLRRENFAMGDVPAGEYIVHARVEGRVYTQKVHVEAGQTAFVTFAAYSTQPTPEAQPHVW